MGTLDMIRTYQDRTDWGKARRNGWKRDLDESNVIADGQRMQDAIDTAHAEVADRAGLPLTSIDRARLDNRAAAERVAELGVEMMRDRQARYVYVLIRQLAEVNPAAADAGLVWFERNKDTLTKNQASMWIDRLKAKIAEGAVSAPVERVQAALDVTKPKANAWAEWREVAGRLAALGRSTGARFAVDTEEGAVNALAFWWIVPGRGAHDGKFFLRQMIGGQGPVRVRLGVDAMLAIARKIEAAGPREAMVRYGREIGSCCRCGRELTNDESRAAGIGPDCRSEGW